MLNLDEQDIDRVTEAFHHLMKGRIPGPVELPPGYPDNEFKQLVGYVNKFMAEYGLLAEAMAALSQGQLDFMPPRGQMHVLQSVKNMHANLRHLTWKTQQIAQGDFGQQIDFMFAFSEAFNSMVQQLKEAFERIEEQRNKLAEANEIISREKEKSDRLLLNVLPARVADELKQTGRTTPELFENVTVLFSDLVGFTTTSATLSPDVLTQELNDLFTHFDAIIDANGCERIKTIGDAYLAVCGMPVPDDAHAVKMVQCAVAMAAWLEERNARSPHVWPIRIGVHSGSVVGAVVGTRKYIYDIFGDTVNTASRMESNSAPMHINISEATYRLLQGRFPCEARPPLAVKGKGDMNMYFVSRNSHGTA